LKRFLHLLFLCFIFIASGGIFLPPAVAQGWLWGRTATGTTFDSWSVATDAGGNVYGGGCAVPGTLDFGSGVSLTVSSPVGSVPVGSGGYGVVQSAWVKYNNSGTPLWAGCTSGAFSWLNNMTVDAEGNLILFGSFMGDSMQIGSFTLTSVYGSIDTSQYYIAKISPTGAVLWAISAGNTCSEWEIFDFAGAAANGGVVTDAAGNIYVTASFITPTMTIGATTLTNTDPSGTTYDVYLAKYSPAGASLWAKSFGGSLNDYGCSIALAATGDVYVTGAFNSPSMTVGMATLTDPYSSTPYGNTLAFVARYTAAGLPVWAQAAGGRNGAFGVGLASDNYGNVFMTGGFGDTSISFGSVTIARTFPTAVPHPALYLVEYSPANVVTWSKTIGSATADLWGCSIALASCGQVWVSGNYSQYALIDGDTLHFVTGYDPVFIAGYNLSGGVAGYAGLGSGGDDLNGIACDAAGNVFICSDIYFSTVYMGPDTLTTPTGSEAFYIGKYANAVTAPPGTITTNRDTAIACGDSLLLSGLHGYTNYYWNTGSTDSTLTIGVGGVYFISNFTCGDSVVVDTFHVAIPSDTLFSLSDSGGCAGTTGITLTAPAGYAVYAWTTGDSLASIIVTDTGSYIVYATTPASCHSVMDTFRVLSLYVDTLIHRHDTTACTPAEDIFITIHMVPPVGSSYSWFDGSSGNTDSVHLFTSGKFWVSYITGCNYNLDTFAVTVVTPCDSGHTAGIAVPRPVQDVNLYPNPVADMLTITTPGQTNYSSCSIVNVLGQALIRQPINGAQTNVNVTSLPAGVYYLLLNNDNGITVRKFVKE